MKNSAFYFALVLMAFISLTACKKDAIILPEEPGTPDQPASYVIAFYNPLDATLFYLQGYSELVKESMSIAATSNASGEGVFTMPVLNYEDQFVVREIQLLETDSLGLESVVAELNSVFDEIQQSPEPINIDRATTLRNNAKCVPIAAREGNCHVTGNESSNTFYDARKVCRDGYETCQEFRTVIGQYKRFKSRNCSGFVLHKVDIMGEACR